MKMSFPDLSNIPQVGQKREGILHLKTILVEKPESSTREKKKKKLPLKTSWLSKERIRLSLGLVSYLKYEGYY